jgi:nitroreductase
MRLGLSADELLSTTRSVRKRLDFDRAVPRDLLVECVELAVQAPNGSNRQGWHWILVDDPHRKQAIADVYRRNFEALTGGGTAGAGASMGTPLGDRVDRNVESGAYLAANLHRCPTLLVPCIAGRHEGLDVPAAASVWGSLLPAVWSFMLALRERGLGSAWTTLHLRDGGERAVAEIIGIPPDEYTQAGLFPIAYTIGTDFRPAERTPAAERIHWNTW